MQESTKCPLEPSAPRNRAKRRAAKFGGKQSEDGSYPLRSRIQRGKSRPTVRGKILRFGIHPILFDEQDVPMDMADFAEQMHKTETT